MILKRFTGTAKEFLEQHFNVVQIDGEVENSAQGVIDYLETHFMPNEDDLLMSECFWNYPLSDKYLAIHNHYYAYDDTLPLWVFDNRIFETLKYYKPTKIDYEKQYFVLLDILRECYNLLGKCGKNSKAFVRNIIQVIIDESEETEV